MMRELLVSRCKISHFFLHGKKRFPKWQGENPTKVLKNFVVSVNYANFVGEKVIFCLQYVGINDF